MIPEKYKEAAMMKWISISHGKTVDMGRHNCILCIIFDEEDEDGAACVNFRGTTCPITTSGFYNCYHSPYQVWLGHHDDKHLDMILKTHCRTCQVIALMEVLFLADVVEMKPPNWTEGKFHELIEYQIVVNKYDTG